MHEIVEGPKEDELKKSKFVIIRHAITNFNMEFAKVCGTYGFES